MLVEHGLEISAICPVDKRADHYECRVRAARTIPVEEILAAAEELRGRELFQEDLTRELHRRLAAKVETVGYHSGVRTTVRIGGGW
jgi:heterodisulfide reductase subunit C